MYKRLIPSILVHKERLIKGTQYKDYRDAGSAATTARAHNAQGADELIVCDIDASKNNTEPDFSTLHKIAQECFMPLCFFGGINSEERAHKAMNIGADKIGMTSTAYDHPSLITSLAHQYGSQAVVIGIDVIAEGNSYRLYDHREDSIRHDHNPLDWAKQCVDLGAGEIRLMHVDREGTAQGLDLNLYKTFKQELNVPILLEGGAESLTHVQNAYEHGVDGVCLGAMLVFSDSNLVKIQQRMRSLNLNIRG